MRAVGVGEVVGERGVARCMSDKQKRRNIFGLSYGRRVRSVRIEESDGVHLRYISCVRRISLLENKVTKTAQKDRAYFFVSFPSSLPSSVPSHARGTFKVSLPFSFVHSTPTATNAIGNSSPLTPRNATTTYEA